MPIVRIVKRNLSPSSKCTFAYINPDFIAYNIAVKDESAEKLLSNEELSIRDIKVFLKKEFNIYDVKEDRRRKINEITENSKED